VSQPLLTVRDFGGWRNSSDDKEFGQSGFGFSSHRLKLLGLEMGDTTGTSSEWVNWICITTLNLYKIWTCQARLLLTSLWEILKLLIRKYKLILHVQYITISYFVQVIYEQYHGWSHVLLEHCFHMQKTLVLQTVIYSHCQSPT